jgi:peptide-methionine (R)-S-oxide reductase
LINFSWNVFREKDNPRFIWLTKSGIMDKLELSDEEWKKRLTEDRFDVLRRKGTEMPFTGSLLHNQEKGVYTCAGCGQELFSHEDKFDSGSGWPSFKDVISRGKVETRTDTTHGMVRTEILCSRCGGHLGHVFDDGPNPTGLRYCVNSLSLEFKQNRKNGN